MSASEHDYATFVIQNAMQDDTGQSQIVYHVQDITPEDLLNGVTMENVEFPETGTYEIIGQASDKPVSQKPKYRRETSVGSSGYWSEADVHRLLKVFLKHVKSQPLLRGKPSNHMWNAIIRDFDSKIKFANIQVKTKIQRLRSVGKSIEQSGHGATTKWPFWKQVSEILALEKENSSGNGEVEQSSQSSSVWTEDESYQLLKAYRKHLGGMVRASSNSDRRLVWARIAASLHRPRYQVTLKFQALKAKWRRWKKGGMDKADSSLSQLTLFNNIMAAEKVARRRKRKQTEDQEVDASPAKKCRNRWSSYNTELVLTKYEQQLRKLKQSGLLTTRRSVYEQVGKEIDIPGSLVQVKISSLKSHFKKFTERMKGGKRRRTNWRYEKILTEIMRLEYAIWMQMDGSDLMIPMSDDESRPAKVRHSCKEPSWFRQYRVEVEKRHEDRVKVLERLLKVIQRLAEN